MPKRRNKRVTLGQRLGFFILVPKPEDKSLPPSGLLQTGGLQGTAASAQCRPAPHSPGQVLPWTSTCCDCSGLVACMHQGIRKIIRQEDQRRNKAHTLCESKTKLLSVHF